MAKRLLAHFAAVIAFTSAASIRADFGAEENDSPAASLQGPATIERLRARGAISSYLEGTVRDVVTRLLQASGERSQIVVNGPYRPGALHVYVLDPRKLDGADELSASIAGSLEGGATSDVDNRIIYASATWLQRLAAATRMTQEKQIPSLGRALATVDVRGLTAVQPYWSSHSGETEAANQTAMLVRGALTFVLAHELSHVQLGARRNIDNTPPPDLASMTKRELDERAACPELNARDASRQQRYESRVDSRAAELLGRQCEIAATGQREQVIIDLGMQWHFLASMWTTMFRMGRATNSAFIAMRLRQELGNELYASLIDEVARPVTPASVRAVFSNSHPADLTRLGNMIELLKRSPCGTDSEVGVELRMFERERVRMCSSLSARRLDL